MHLDLDDADRPVGRETEICVVGSGAAGITIARTLLAYGHEVLLLESGGLDYEPAIADLNAGENVGEPYYDLKEARLRFFGGTTAIWGGRCAEFSQCDFEKRDWVPYSGWPLRRSDLDSYYRSARSMFGLSGDAPAVDGLARSGVELPAFDDAQLACCLWTFDGRFNRFAFDTCRDLRRHPRCLVVTHATVAEIVADPSGRSISQVEARSLGGRHLTVRARLFVLAAGGIENARLLLASRSVMSCGLGNGHDLVGRFFMEHPHARGGRVVSDRAWMLLQAFARRHVVESEEVAALIAPSERLQREAGILNSSLTIVGRQPIGNRQFWGMRVYNRAKHSLAPTRKGRALWLFTKKTAAVAQRLADPARPWLLHKLGRLELALLVRGEQAPNPDSRVTLSETRDALGVPQVRLDWRLSDLDIVSVERLVGALDAELRRLRLGEVEPAEWASSHVAGDPIR